MKQTFTCEECFTITEMRKKAYLSTCQECSFKKWSGPNDGTKVLRQHKVRCGCLCWSGSPCGKKPGSRFIECTWCNTKVAVGCCAATGMACHMCTNSFWEDSEMKGSVKHSPPMVRCFGSEKAQYYVHCGGSIGGVD